MTEIVRIILILSAGISIAITTRMLAGHWLYNRQVINQSTLWTGATLVLTMFLIMFLTIGKIGYPPIWWRLVLEPSIIGLSIIAGIIRYREIKGWNTGKRPKQSLEEENLERFRNTTDDLLTSGSPEVNRPPLVRGGDD